MRQMDSESKEPMSVVHKWCCDALRIIHNKTVIFQTREKWASRLNETNIYGICQQLLCWLDLLKMDRLLFEDETHRPGVPRLTKENELITQPQDVELQSRREAQQFIIEEGNKLFKERGWYEGLAAWKDKTKIFY